MSYSVCRAESGVDDRGREAVEVERRAETSRQFFLAMGENMGMV
jgi:hypothetical protein